MASELTTTNQRAISFSLLENWQAYIDVSERTAEEYCRAVKRLLSWLQRNNIPTPTRETILEYKKDMQATLKPSSVQLNIVAIRLFFKWTSQTGLYPNITEHLKGIKVDTTTHKKDSLPAQSLNKIMAGIDTDTKIGKRDYALFLLLAVCGLRSIEAARANIEDLRTTGNKTTLFIQGKGRTDKTDFVIVPDIVETALRSYIQERKTAKSTDPLFASASNHSTDEGRLTTRSIRRIIKGRLLSAGYNSERLTTHSLRHTAVTLALLAGKPIDEVMKFARHRNLQTTMIYNHKLEKINNTCSAAIAETLTRQTADTVC